MEDLEKWNTDEIYLNVISSIYPVIVSVDLTKNTYMKLEYEPVLSEKKISTGVFDDLIFNGLGRMDFESRKIFLSSFSRKALINCFLNGKMEVYEEIKQYCADGKEHWLEIHAICVSNKKDDVREVCLVRIIDDKKEQESKWKQQFDVMNHEIQERENSLRKALEYEKLLNECMRIFYRVGNLKHSVDRVMEMTAGYFPVDRSFVCEVHKEKVFNTFEFCARDVKPKKEWMQDLDLHIFDCWMPLFQEDKYAVCEDVEKLPKDAEELRSLLKKADIRQMILIPVSFEGKIRLLLGYDNPKLENENFMPMMDTLISMVLMGINRVYMERKRNTLTYKDSLTALWNRTRMNEDIHGIKKGEESAGILFLDVNGLKEVNDKCSHEAGDLLLKTCADVIVKRFPESVEDTSDFCERAYRIGGDEFVVWLKNITQEKFSTLQQELRELYQMEKNCSVSIGGVFMEHAEDIFGMIKEADARMYQEKQRYYKECGKELPC